MELVQCKHKFQYSLVSAAPTEIHFSAFKMCFFNYYLKSYLVLWVLLVFYWLPVNAWILYRLIKTDAASMFLLAGMKISLKTEDHLDKIVVLLLNHFVRQVNNKTPLFSWAELKMLELINMKQWVLTRHRCWCLLCNSTSKYHFKSAVGVKGSKQEMAGGHRVPI